MLWSRIIDLVWGNKKLEKSCSTDKAGRRKWGPEHWRILQKRLMVLRGAPNLDVVQGMPGGCHPLKADRRGQFAIDLWGPYRLIIVPDHDVAASDVHGGLDLAQVTRIKVTEVVDYHGR